MQVMLLSLLLAAAGALALQPAYMGAQIQALVQAPPSLLPRPGAANPDEDGIVVEDVVNVHKRAIILIRSACGLEGVERRDAIRDTWMQALNRSSEYTMAKEDRKSFTAWFVIPHDYSRPAEMAVVEAEGKLNGDILIVNSANGVTMNEFDVFGAVIRWLRVAYFQRFSFGLFVGDQAFVSTYNLKKFVDDNESSGNYYGGYVNRYVEAPDWYVHRYFASFVEGSTLMLGKNTVELISRELDSIRRLPRFDVALGNFLSSYEHYPTVHDKRFVNKLSQVYSVVPDPLVVNGLTRDVMQTLAEPMLVDGKLVTPALKAQVPELESRVLYVNPHPDEVEPACDGLTGGRCNSKGLKLASSESH